MASCHLFYARVNTDARNAYELLRSSVPGFDNLLTMLDGLRSPINAFQDAFPDVAIFNGDVSKTKRKKVIDDFNASGNKTNVILAQRASAKEGISMHDIDGLHQRVFIDLGIPGRPTDAIQSEGRIIRLGMQSNGIIEYLTTGTNFERYTFAQTIATRASTAENLAMGENARALLQSFSTGYNDASPIKPSSEQGVGGKKADAARESGDPFENAVALYYTNQKKTSKNKAEEGVDYFATPEPLGFKMVEWAGIRPGDRVLEPSGGHGAIARFFPDSTIRHAVEPSYELASRLALNAPDITIHQSKFEDYNLVNKFDAIVMNPPFGTAGKTAMDHLDKAARHLKTGGRIVALIPMGSSMEKRFDKWYDEVQGMYMVADIRLPSVTFERAGTSVSARVVILDKADVATASQSVNRDYSNATSTKEFFERIKDSSVPPRQALTKEKTPAEMMAELLSAGRDGVIPEASESVVNGNDFSPKEFTHTKNGNAIFVATINRKLDKAEYNIASATAKKHGGYYSSYNKGGAIPGFHFPDAESRDAFLGGSDQATESLQAAPLPSLRADSPEWKAMSKEQRKEYMRAKRDGGLEAAPLPETAGQDVVNEADSVRNVFGSYEIGTKENLSKWEKNALQNAEKSAGRGNVLPARLTFEDGSQPRPSTRFAAALLRAFNKRLLFVAPSGSNKLPFEGMMHPSDTNTLIVDASSQLGFSFIVGHELGHSIQHQQPDLYNSLKKTLLEMAKDWGDYNARLAKVKDYDTQEKRDAEFINDFIGSQFGEPKFWRMLQESNPNVFRKVLDAALEYLAALSEKIGALHRDVRPYFDNIEAARSELVKTLEAYRRGKMLAKSVKKEALIESPNGELSTDLNAAPLPSPDEEAAANVAGFRMEGRKAINKAIADEARKQQELFKDDGKVVGAPRLANPGDTKRSRDEQDIAHELYENTRTVQKDADVMREARRRFKEDPRGVEEKMLSAINGKIFAEDPADHLAYQMLINERAKQAGNDLDKHEEIMILRMAYQSARGDAGRLLRIGYDRHQTPEERYREMLTDAIYTPSLKIKNEARNPNWSPQQRREYIRQQSSLRMREIDKAFKEMGITLDEVLSGQAFLSLSQEQILKDALKRRNAEEQHVIKLIQKKWSLSRIRRAITGMTEARIQEINKKLYDELMEKARIKARAGIRLENYRDKLQGLEAASLNAAELTDEEVEAEARRIVEVGFGISPTVTNQKLARRTPTKKEKAEMTDAEKEELEQLAVDRTASRWISKLSVSQSDTLAWKDKNSKKRNELDALIRSHIRKADPDFQAKAEKLGATSEQARLLEGTANEERKRISTIRLTRKEQKARAKDDRNALTANWSRPTFTDGLNSYEFDTKDRNNILQRVKAIQSIAGATGKIKTLVGDQKEKALKLLDELNEILGKYGTDANGIFDSGKPVDDYRFDILDRNHVAAVNPLFPFPDRPPSVFSSLGEKANS